MASRGQYLLRIGGRLRGDVQERAVRRMLGGIFDEPKGPGRGVPGETNVGGWPAGFILRNYIPCQWQLSIDHPRRNETMIGFRAEIHHTLPGSLFDNRQIMLPQVRWFYNYRRYRWYRELIERLNGINANLTGEFRQALVERVWFRDWQWYCGNGGC